MVFVKPLCDFTGYHKFEMHENLKTLFLISTTKELDKQEFQQFCEEVRSWASVDLGVKLQAPNEYE